MAQRSGHGTMFNGRTQRTFYNIYQSGQAGVLCRVRYHDHRESKWWLYSAGKS